MTFLRRFRLVAGAFVLDWPRFESRLHGLGARSGTPEPWLGIRNRAETLTASPDGRGFRCEWRFGHDLHIANVFPSTGRRLMRLALKRWPVGFADATKCSGTPLVTFVIGHRGLDRLPHLLATLRSIAAQTVPVECIVVEQSETAQAVGRLPPWVRYVHTPLPQAGLPFCRSWAFNVGVREARSQVLILHDNDILVPKAYAAEAAARVTDGWMFANLKRFLFYLTDSESGRIFSGNTLRPVGARVTQNLHGGSIVATRAAYAAIGGFDESFVGWGGEDNDFWERAATTERIYDFGYLPMVHLHHDDQPGKRERETAAIAHYEALETVPPRDRIARLLRKEQGSGDGPATG